MGSTAGDTADGAAVAKRLVGVFLSTLIAFPVYNVVVACPFDADSLGFLGLVVRIHREGESKDVFGKGSN